MANTRTPALVAVVAVILGIVGIYFQPARDFLAQYGFHSLGLVSPTPIVVDPVRNITYLGSQSSGVEHFHEIFYAENPSGERRFAPPVPVKPTKGSIIDATRPGAWCPQGTGDVLPFTSQVTNISENCLSLRIARPSGVSKNARLPVVVWIHGGGHALGSGSDILYTPDGLVEQAAADNQHLIYVAINYRFGLFGFATSKAMIEAGQANAGLRDQRAALEWVRDNIEVFGGDPSKVTVLGQSVGASDIGLHLTAFDGTQGVPFQQAIMMSGGPGLNFNSKPDLVAENTAAIARQVGCVEDSDDQSFKVLECLRNVPFETLTDLSVAASRAARPPFGEGFFYPTIDGDFIRDRPSQLMRAGKFVKGIPVIGSWVTNDGAWYASPHTSTDEDVLASFGRWLVGLSNSTKQRLLELYPREDFEHMVRRDYDGPISTQYYRAAQINRDIWFTCPVLDFTWQYVKNGGVDSSQVRVYEHNSTRFTPVFETMGVPMWRVAHLSDIPYALNTQHLEGGADNSASQLALARVVSRAITNFVNTGTPEKSESQTETWPAVFSGLTSEDLSRESPSRLSIQVFGGPYGTVPVTVGRDTDGSMAGEAEEAIQAAQLFRRCEFINSELVRAETGV
ncbi:alpha/beta-hydrolase [Aspergillus steynii IBT 23096]|uniref:Alpha/beta-hydrolase n=1 Tax=Aspergillus steynii IBT 23096 TaxID=1392250 RepID=A0A2I2GRE7_9EURO|nr:alpha/beta-hydrolase [Aspergillus steynii IBT 23096]PLB55452.1 alpha/beta-hydrolase [Aspergillus steynii IBT 23096]